MLPVEEAMHDPQLPEWTCPGCGARNQEDLVSCWSCDEPRPSTESYADLLQDDIEVEPQQVYST
jgi:uncharacterized membrane protein YvbJ